ncbi:hypothetical protein [Mesorhizobium sp. M1405]|uniref:hypothetical protein n=1 Tax=Mesorhizobium sp. M1405 TaxID=2957098 RepID=UPI00333733D5
MIDLIGSSTKFVSRGELCRFLFKGINLVYELLITQLTQCACPLHPHNAPALSIPIKTVSKVMPARIRRKTKIMGFQSQDALKSSVAIGILVSSAIATMRKGALASVKSIAVTDSLAENACTPNATPVVRPIAAAAISRAQAPR